jgi:hypothetical protein
VSVRTPESDDRGHARLDDRIVGLLEREGGVFAFNGLRRALAAHPESLTRALRRLERFGVVRRGDSGYALVQPEGAGPETEPKERPSLYPIGSVELPAEVDRTGVFGQLAGRWMGRLRWVGVYESRDDPWLVWTLDGTRDQVYLSVRGRRLEVGIDAPTGPRAEAVERAAVDLLRLSLARLLHPADSGGSLTTLQADSRPRYLVPN